LDLQPLDNIVWHCLTGAHAGFARGTAGARRYGPGFSPIVGFASPQAPDLAAFAPHCEPGEVLYCAAWSTPAPAGWAIDEETSMAQLLWPGGPPADDVALQTVRLGLAHVDAVLALVALTQPGPFGPRTIELGDYYGVFNDGRLVAMAGERMSAGRLQEISAVCTHPAFQGRGLARRLVAKLLRLQVGRGQLPFLHVVDENAAARRLYERMGFVHHQNLVVRVVSRAPAVARAES
jgi:ribosomal protein S18 acetylase RimI-like enzyme